MSEPVKSLIDKGANGAFLEGLTSIFDVSGTGSLYDFKLGSFADDRRALWGDWCRIGEDLTKVLQQELTTLEKNTDARKP